MQVRDFVYHRTGREAWPGNYIVQPKKLILAIHSFLYWRFRATVTLWSTRAYFVVLYPFLV